MALVVPRRIRVMIVNLMLSTLLVGIGAAAAGARLHAEAAVTRDSVPISVTIASRERPAGPIFQVTGAYPGMKPEVARVTLMNNGHVPVVYDVSVALNAAADDHGLDEVLVVEVSHSGDVVYSGALSDLAIAGSRPLAPHSSVTYRTEISWPDGGATDNQYQGMSLRFDIVARSREPI